MPDPQTLNWGGLSWSPWFPFDAAVGERRIPTSAGVYRFRSRGETGLLYIGEGTNRLRRLATLARKRRQPANHYLVYPPGSQRPHRGHYAAPAIRQCEDAGCIVEVSWTNDEDPDTKDRRKAEAGLIRLHLDEIGYEPPCQHGGRGLVLYLQQRTAAAPRPY